MSLAGFLSAKIDLVVSNEKWNELGREEGSPTTRLLIEGDDFRTGVSTLA
jgi:hypothetical protein